MPPGGAVTAPARESYSLGLGRKHEPGGIPHVFQEAFHVLSSCSIIQDAAPQSELAANTCIRQVTATCMLQSDQDALVQRVEIARIIAGSETEAEDREPHRSKQL